MTFAIGRPLGEGLTIRGGGGVLVDGKLLPSDGSEHEFDPGGLVFVGADRRGRVADGTAPAVDFSAQIAYSWARTVDQDTDRTADYSAFDLRLGARATWSIDDRLFPMVAVRVFGGPANWELAGESVTGSDIHHYQLALGAAASVGPAALFVEWAPMGEQGLGAGIGAVW